jgi:selenocysteine-specific elongation factor
MPVIATAGHVDHGKSALVEALTGIHPDRLKEEQIREMTIDLGFAWLTLPNGETVGIVDVPGHLDFIENMLAGVGGIDAALLVVAADEGVMPQTREHFAILTLLEVCRGVVALNKTDLADPEWLALVEEEIRALLQGTCWEAAPIVPVSARTRAGLEALVAALQQALEGQPPPPDLGRARLSIDRVFTMPGFGTVVTGTLRDGCFRVGDEVEIWPSGRCARIRGLQSYRRRVEQALPGSRVAINLSGVSPGGAPPGRLGDGPRTVRAHRPPRRRADPLGGIPAAASPFRRGEIFPRGGPDHGPGPPPGSGDPASRGDGVRPAGAEPSHGGRAGGPFHPPLAFALHHPGRRGDPGRPSGSPPPPAPPGGPHDPPGPPPRGPRVPAAGLVAGGRIPRPPEASRRLALPPETVRRWFEALAERGEAIPLAGDLWRAPDWQARAVGQLVERVEAYHRENPLRRGMPREEARSRLGWPAPIFEAVLQAALREGQIEEIGPLIRHPGFTIRLTETQRQQVETWLTGLRRDPWHPPTWKEAEAALGRELLQALLDEGRLIRLGEELVMPTETWNEAVARIREHLQAHGTISAAEARDLLRTSRRVAVALLEQMDALGITRRVGDVRVWGAESGGDPGSKPSAS